MTTATSITVRVPLTICRRGGRKLVVTPDGSAPGAATTSIMADPALVKAIAQAHRWKRLLQSGHYASLSELAVAEKSDRSYLGKMLRLTLLAPDIVESILNGELMPESGLSGLLERFPSDWREQKRQLHDCLSERPNP